MNEQTFWETQVPKATPPTKENPTEPAGLPPTSLALTVPKEVSALAVGSQQTVEIANQFVVDSEAAFQVADIQQAQLKAEAKQLTEKRMEFTRPIDALKKKWTEFFSPAVDGRMQAAGIYQTKMSAFLRKQREENAERQRQAEALIAEENRKKEEAARKLEEKAAKLKTPAAQQKALAEAETIRNVAALTPPSIPMAPPPTAVASNVAQTWKAEILGTGMFLRWLILHPEWESCIQFKDAEMNRLARQMRDAVSVPGVRFYPQESFRTKPR